MKEVQAHLAGGNLPSALVHVHTERRRRVHVKREVLEALAYASLELEQAQREADEAWYAGMGMPCLLLMSKWQQFTV